MKGGIGNSQTYLNLIPDLPNTQPRGDGIGLQALLTLIPCITNPHRYLRTVAVERDRRHWPREPGILPQPLLNFVVPDGYGAIRTSRCKGVESWVEGEAVDGPYMVNIVDRLAVTFECVFLFLRRGRGVEVFDSDTTFDRGGCVT